MSSSPARTFAAVLEGDADAPFATLRRNELIRPRPASGLRPGHRPATRPDIMPAKRGHRPYAWQENG